MCLYLLFQCVSHWVSWQIFNFLWTCNILFKIFKAIADPVPNELKEFNEKLAAAKKALADAKKYLASDYIQNFATILENGVEKLHVCF